MSDYPSKEVLNSLARDSLVVFCMTAFHVLNPGRTLELAWMIHAIAHHLEQAASGRFLRLIINAPPRSLKSQIASIFFPAFLLGRDPTKRIICISYGQDLSQTLARSFRRVISSAFYQELFPGVQVQKETDQTFETTQGGFRYATSIGGSLTGHGGDILIIDDPLKASDAYSKPARDEANSFIIRSAMSRLDERAKGVVIVVQQRLHEGDLTGVLMHQEGWRHLKLAAVASEDLTVEIGPDRHHEWRKGELLLPDRLPLRQLRSVELELGSVDYSAQYLQEARPETGYIIQRQWLKSYTKLPPRGDGVIVQSWDTAQKPGESNDYSVCTTWLRQDGKHYLMDVVRQRRDFPSLGRLAFDLHAKFSPSTILIEEHGSGTPLIQELKARYRINTQGYRPKGDKEGRLRGVSSFFECGDIHLPVDAPWHGEFVEELIGFPQTRHDDQVDSVSQYLSWVREQPDKDHFEFDFGYDVPLWTPFRSAGSPFRR